MGGGSNWGAKSVVGVAASDFKDWVSVLMFLALLKLLSFNFCSSYGGRLSTPTVSTAVTLKGSKTSMQWSSSQGAGASRRHCRRQDHLP